MSEIASALGKTSDAANYQAQYIRGVANYNKAYFNEVVGGYSPDIRSPHGSQCRYYFLFKRLQVICTYLFSIIL